MKQLKKSDVDQRFDVIEKDINEIKDLLIQNNMKRIEKLEIDIKELRKALVSK